MLGFVRLWSCNPRENHVVESKGNSHACVLTPHSHTMNTYTRSCDQWNKHDKNWAALILFSVAICLFSLQASALSPTNPTVVLEYFQGKQLPGTAKVNLEWTCSSQNNNAAFKLYRSSNQENWNLIQEFSGAGTTGNTEIYNFTDIGITYQDWFYKLEWIDTAGEFDTSTIEVKVENPTAVLSDGTTLANFTAKAFPDHSLVLLKWSTQNESSNEQVMIYRSRDRSNWTLIAPLNSLSTQRGQTEHTFYDSEALLGTMFYKIQWPNTNGMLESRVIEVTNGDLESMNNLAKNSSTQISSFIASPNALGDAMQITWKVKADKALREFVILHSLDKITWRVIEISKSGSYEELVTVNHNSAENGMNFYKILCFDKDDAFSFATVSAGLDKPSAFYQPFPNPAFNKVTIQSEQQLQFPESVTIFNTRGGEYDVPTNNKAGQLEMDISEVPSGVYIVKLGDGFVRFQKD